MNTKSLTRSISTFVASLAIGCGATLALASVAAVSHVSPSLAPAAASHAAPEVIRLDPVVVTISREKYAAIQTEVRATTLAALTARDTASRRATRG